MGKIQKLAKGAPAVISPAFFGEKGLVKTHAHRHPFGKQNKIPGGDASRDQVEKPQPKPTGQQGKDSVENDVSVHKFSVYRFGLANSTNRYRWIPTCSGRTTMIVCLRLRPIGPIASHAGRPQCRREDPSGNQPTERTEITHKINEWVKMGDPGQRGSVVSGNRRLHHR